LYFIYQW